MDEFDKVLEDLFVPSTPTATPSATTETPGANNSKFIPTEEQEEALNWVESLDENEGREERLEAKKKEDERLALRVRKRAARRTASAAYEKEEKERFKEQLNEQLKEQPEVKKKGSFFGNIGHRRKSAPAGSLNAPASPLSVPASPLSTPAGPPKPDFKKIDELEWRSFNTWVLDLASGLRDCSSSFNRIVSKEAKEFEVEPLKNDETYNPYNPVYVIHYFKDFWDKIEGFYKAEKVELEGSGELGNFIRAIDEDNKKWEELGWENAEFLTDQKAIEPVLNKDYYVIKAFDGWLEIIKKNIINLQDKVGKENIKKISGSKEMWKNYNDLVEKYNSFVAKQNKIVNNKSSNEELLNRISKNDRKAQEIATRIVHPIFVDEKFEGSKGSKGSEPAGVLENFLTKQAQKCEAGKASTKYEKLKAILSDANMIGDAGTLCTRLCDFYKVLMPSNRSLVATMLSGYINNIRNLSVNSEQLGKLEGEFNDLLYVVKRNIDDLEKVYDNVEKAYKKDKSIFGEDHDFIFGKDGNNCWRVYQNENGVEKEIGYIAEVYSKVVEKDEKQEVNVSLKDPNGGVIPYKGARTYGSLSDFLRGSVGYLSFYDNCAPGKPIDCHYTDEEGKENFVIFNANGMAIEINRQGETMEINKNSNAFKQLKQAFEGNQSSSIPPQGDLYINNNEKNEGGINVETKSFNDIRKDYVDFANQFNEFLKPYPEDSKDLDRIISKLEGDYDSKDAGAWKNKIDMNKIPGEIGEESTENKELLKNYVDMANIFEPYLISKKNKQTYTNDFQMARLHQESTNDAAVTEDIKRLNEDFPKMRVELNETLKKMKKEANGGSSIFKKGINAVWSYLKGFVNSDKEVNIEKLSNTIEASVPNLGESGSTNVAGALAKKVEDNDLGSKEEVAEILQDAADGVSMPNKSNDDSQKDAEKQSETVDDPKLEEAKKQLRDFVAKYNGFLSIRSEFAKKYGKTEKDKKIFNESILKNYRVDWWDKFEKYELGDLSDIDFVKTAWSQVIADLIGKYLPTGESDSTTEEIFYIGTRFNSAKSNGEKLKILGEYHTKATELLNKVKKVLEDLAKKSEEISKNQGVVGGAFEGLTDRLESSSKSDTNSTNTQPVQNDTKKSWVDIIEGSRERYSKFKSGLDDFVKDNKNAKDIIARTLNKNVFNVDAWKNGVKDEIGTDVVSGDNASLRLGKYRMIAKVLIQYFNKNGNAGKEWGGENGKFDYKFYFGIATDVDNFFSKRYENDDKKELERRERIVNNAVKSLSSMLDDLEGGLAELKEAAANGGEKTNENVYKTNENEKVEQKEEGEATKVVEAPKSEEVAKSAKASGAATRENGLPPIPQNELPPASVGGNGMTLPQTPLPLTPSEQAEKELLSTSSEGREAKKQVEDAIGKYNDFVKDYNGFVGKFKEEGNLSGLIEKVTKLKEGPNKKIIWLHEDMRSLTSVSGKTFNTIEELNKAWVDLINKLAEYFPEANQSAYTGKAVKISASIKGSKYKNKNIDNLEKLKLMEKYNKMCDEMLNYTNGVLKELEKKAEHKGYLKDATTLLLEEFVEKYNELLSRGCIIAQTSGNGSASGIDGEWRFNFSVGYQLRLVDYKGDVQVRWVKVLYDLIDNVLPEGDPEGDPEENVKEKFRNKLGDIGNFELLGNSVNESKVLKKYHKLSEELFNETKNALDRLEGTEANGGEKTNENVYKTNENEKVEQKEEGEATKVVEAPKSEEVAKSAKASGAATRENGLPPIPQNELPPASVGERGIQKEKLGSINKFNKLCNRYNRFIDGCNGLVNRVKGKMVKILPENLKKNSNWSYAAKHHDVNVSIQGYTVEGISSGWNKLLDLIITWLPAANEKAFRVESDNIASAIDSEKTDAKKLELVEKYNLLAKKALGYMEKVLARLNTKVEKSESGLAGKVLSKLGKGKEIIESKLGLEEKESERDLEKEDLSLDKEEDGKYKDKNSSKVGETFRLAAQLLTKEKGFNITSFANCFSGVKGFKGSLNVALTSSKFKSWGIGTNDEDKEKRAAMGVLFVSMAYLPGGSESIVDACDGLRKGGLKGTSNGFVEHASKIRKSIKESALKGITGDELVKELKSKNTIKEDCEYFIENPSTSISEISGKLKSGGLAKLGRKAKNAVKAAREKIGKSSKKAAESQVNAGGMDTGNVINASPLVSGAGGSNSKGPKKEGIWKRGKNFISRKLSRNKKGETEENE